ncbi:hypothetical protein PO124_05090 [Bacillus licheniformis]|nr:hypothetical protein [Bacillus licheniformis]
MQSGEPAHIAIASVKGAEITGFVKSYVYHYIDNIAAIGKSAQGNEKRFEEMYKITGILKRVSKHLRLKTRRK